jgi:hypothetical protein
MAGASGEFRGRIEAEKTKHIEKHCLLSAGNSA